MPEQTQLGAYFSENSLSFLEVEKESLTNFFEIPCADIDRITQITDPAATQLSGVITNIQKTFQERSIEKTEVHLSLPTKDIILRSFVIPSMSSNEVKGVVEFEAKRYIPFKLEELAYQYYASNITENKIRKIQILFIAIRKATLEKYCQVLEQAGLRVIFIEPSALSLLRILILKKHIARKQKVAFIQAIGAEGAIVIANDNVPQFVRDFKIEEPVGGTSETNGNHLSLRIFRDVRISLDYFYRKHRQEKVEKIIILSSYGLSNLASSIKNELGIETTVIEPKSLLDLRTEASAGVLNAFGATLRNPSAFPVKLNLAKTRPDAFGEKIPDIEPINYMLIGKIGAICAGVILLIFIICRMNVFFYTKRLETLEEKLGESKEMAIDALKNRATQEQSKLETYKNIRLNSNLSYFMDRIPKLLPEGIWLSDLSVQYSDIEVGGRRPSRRSSRQESSAPQTEAKISIEFQGYAFDKDPNRQITLVYDLVKNLNEDEDFSKQFKNINLISANKTNLEKHTVTRFQMKCD